MLRSLVLLLAVSTTLSLQAQLAGPGVDAVPPARFVPIGEAWAGSSVNVVANRRHALFTSGGYQFAAYYDNDGQMILARRQLETDHWERQATRLRGAVADAHNAISIAIDGDGFLHVAWDHHGQPLNYARGTEPLGLELGPRLPMTGKLENRVTYPEFHRLPNGDLLCLYRDGQSGRGRLVLNRYRVTSRRWETVQDNLIDGEGERSPYWGATVDAMGRLHLAWIWRETPDVATNHDLAYAFSDDGGATWQRINGSTTQPPFTLASSDYAARIPQSRQLMNSPWVTADAAGRPYLVSYWSDTEGSPPQFRAVHHDGRAWRTRSLTEREGAFELAGAATKRPPISRGVVLVGGSTDEPTLHLVYRDDALDGRIVLRSGSLLGADVWVQRILTRGSVDAWEPVIDPIQWEEQRKIHLLVQPAVQRDGDDRNAAQVPPTVIGVLEVAETQ